MYLRNIRIKDLGPIEKLEIDLPFSEKGLPEPIALVGTNGSGKTILLSHIADALHEFAAKAFVDALPQHGAGHAFFMLGSGTHVRLGAKGGFCYLKFDAEKASPQYIYKSGQMEFEDCKASTEGLLAGPFGPWDNEGNHKATDWADQKQIHEQFQTQSHCFFPSHRFEYPHWLNVEALKTSGKYASMRPRFRTQLDDPIMVENASAMNQAWLLDVVLDMHLYGNQPAIALLQQNAINQLIQAILGRPDVRFGIGPRTSPNRISIVSDDGKGNIEPVCPSLDHLSAGQAILFNLFATIIRYADKSGQSIPQQIKGLVLIDEADTHLHIDLQYHVFPRLIKLFPNIQFIFTSHSPLLLLGMENEFSDAFHIIEMPNGSEIGAERFSEFATAFEVLKQTDAFNEHVNTIIRGITKPVVFVEGKTDERYLKKAFKVFGKEAYLNSIEIKRIGVDDGAGGRGDGKGALKKAVDFVMAHPEVVHQRILFLFDHDANQIDVDKEMVFVRSLKRNEENTIFKNGIENLFPIDLARLIKGNNEFWEVRKKDKGDGGEVIDKKLKKSEVCDYICNQRVSPDEAADFNNFAEIVDEIIHILLLGENSS